jgi:ribonuclease VapC
MILDASAVIAILEGEPEEASLIAALDRAEVIRISAATVVEAGIIVEARRGEEGGRELDLLLHRLRAEVVSVTAEQAELARAAYRQFGKGIHAAALNFADCFVYALAASLGEPVLFVGEVFAKTDVESAPY